MSASPTLPPSARPRAGDATGGAWALECRGIRKTFPGVVALDHVDLAIRRGEIHGLVGQNGAGKSTFVKILTGVYAADVGEILLDGATVRIAGPNDAEAFGIAIVHQDQQLVPLFDVTRNVFLGCEKVGFGGLLDLAQMRATTVALLDKIGASFGPDTLIRDLSVAQREQVAIAGALLRNPRILILDEPTASLSSREVEHLFSIIRSLRDAGVTIIYISHYIPEVFLLVDRISVFRDGRLMQTLPVAQTSPTGIIHLMVGGELQQLYPKEDIAPGEPVLEIRHLSQGSRVHDVSLTVHRGEILGIAGLMGAGRTELALALVGALRRSGGEVVLNGRPSAPRSPRAAKQEGFALIPEDRRNEGLIADMSVRENLTLPNIGQWAKWGVLKLRQERASAVELVERLRIRPPSLGQLARNLSGGNQQKMVIGRWLTGGAKVFIFDQPTTGVDVGSRVEIYRQMTELARQGAAVLLISSDFEEVLGMSDRIAVMHKGHIIRTLERGEGDLRNLLYWATGGVASLAAAAASEATPGGRTPAAGRDWAALLSRWGTVAGMLLALLVIGIAAPRFFAADNLFDVFKQGSVLALIALGLTAVLISGGFDMSVGAGSQMTANFAAGIILQGLGTGVALLVGALAGIAAGVMNALLVVGLRMQPFVATLGSMFVMMGITLLYNGGHALTIYDQPTFFFLGQGHIGPVPFVIIMLAVVVAALHVTFKRTRAGLHMYAVGENLAAAQLRGISQRRAVIGSFAIGGLVIGFAGVVLASYSYGASALGTGMDFLISALAAAFLGSTLSRTGELDIIGTTIAAIFLASLSNGLILMGVSNLALPGIQGLILVLSIMLGVVHKRDIGQVLIF